MKPVRVIVVDDSPLMRNFLSESIANSEGFEVVATAHDGTDAWEKIQAEAPNVVTLDVEMPGMDGITLLKRIMSSHPVAVVMVSGLTQAGAQVTLEALQLGAVDVIGKPVSPAAREHTAWINELVMKLRRAATVRPLAKTLSSRTGLAAMAISSTNRGARKCQERLIVVGAGSGAIDALSQFVIELPRDCPPVVVALQLSPVVLMTWAATVGRACAAKLRVGVDGDALTRGVVYVGPGDRHVAVSTAGQESHLKLTEGAPINGYRPKIDFLFESVSRLTPGDVAAILFDSAGEDGETSLRVLAKHRIRAIRQERPAAGGERQTVQKQLGSRSHRPLEPVELSMARMSDYVFNTKLARPT